MVKLNRYYRLLDFCNNFVYTTNIVCTLLYCLLLIMVELEERMGEMCCALENIFKAQQFLTY